MLPDRNTPPIWLVDATAPFPDACFVEPGGFAWWYLDVCDADGNGLVLIPSWGLPFLPGRESAARRGEGTAADTAPSLNVALYHRGRRAAYLLQRMPADACHRDGSTWTFGASSICVERDGDEVEVRVELDVPSPAGGRLHGRVAARGPRSRHAGAEAGAGAPHCWGPVMPAGTAQAELTWDGEVTSIRGAAYLDRNWSTRSLSALGISRWVWARWTHADSTRIVYRVDAPRWHGGGVTLDLASGPDGRAHLGDATTFLETSTRSSFFGLPLPTALRVDRDDVCTHVSVSRWVDVGPFYARAVAHGDDGGHGFLEVVEPGRIDGDRMRPLVRMAVHDTAGSNSMWLPLFAGPRAGRWRRLLRAMRAA